MRAGEFPEGKYTLRAKICLLYTSDRKADGSMTIYVESAGVSQKFLFTPV